MQDICGESLSEVYSLRLHVSSAKIIIHVATSETVDLDDITCRARHIDDTTDRTYSQQSMYVCGSHEFSMLGPNHCLLDVESGENVSSPVYKQYIYIVCR